MSEHTKVSILGIDVIRLEEEEAVRESLKLVREPGVGMVYFLTAQSSLLCQQDRKAADFLNCCRLVLPGDFHTERAFCHLMEGEAGREPDGEYAGNYMKQLFPAMNEEELSIYAVMDSEEALLALQEFILTTYPGMNLDGILFERDNEEEAGRIVNDMNACVPDVALICLPAERQIAFVRDYSPMMNTGLCICMESMQPIHKETLAIPKIFQVCRLEKLYLWFKKENKLQALIEGSIFRKKVLTDGQDGQ